MLRDTGQHIRDASKVKYVYTALLLLQMIKMESGEMSDERVVQG